MSNRKEYEFKQVKMRRENSIDISWIPAKFAKVGRNLSLLTNEEWVDGWKVEEVYEGTRTLDEMDAQRDAQKRWLSVLDHGKRE